MPKLILVDGSSYLYRAFHALPDLRTSRGEPTGAIRGVLMMLRRLVEDGKPDYFAVVFDAPGKTFRDDWYPEYKANRTPMPDPLAAQIAPLHELIRTHGWPLLMVDGVEADDVIGTLARSAEAAGMETLISTGDKDLAQLVTPRVTLMNTMSNEKLDEPGVVAKFGVRVDQVGPKTAAKWLSDYGTLDSVMAHAGEIGGVVGENLRAALPWLPQGRRLLTVKTDCHLPFAPTDLVIQTPEPAALRSLLERFEFKALIKDTAPLAAASPAAQVPALRDEPAAAAPATARNYELVLDEPAFARWLATIDAAPLVSFATESSSFDPMQARIVGLSFSAEAGTAAYIPLAHRYAGAPAQLSLEAVLARLKPWFENPARLKLGQNVKYDEHVLANHGIALAGVAHDTMLESYVLESHRSHDLLDLASRHLDLKTIGYSEVAGNGASQIGFDQVAIERAAEYAAQSAD